MLSQNDISTMSPHQLKLLLQKAVVRGCRKVMTKDLPMLAIGAHEQSICHRLAVYLERFADLNVDCEYNRQMLHPKSIRDGRIKPDILIHKRLDSRFNLLVLEAKAGAKTSNRDRQKIEEMVHVAGSYQYLLGAYLHVENNRRRVLETGRVKMTLHWHGDADPEVLETRIPHSLLAIIAQQPE